MQLLIFILLFFSACQSRSLEDYREEGEQITEELIQTLQQVHNREQLIASTTTLKRLFQRLADVIIAAEEFRSRTSAEPLPLSPHNLELSELLRTEMNSILQIDGARDILEKCQEEAVFKLIP